MLAVLLSSCPCCRPPNVSIRTVGGAYGVHSNVFTHKFESRLPEGQLALFHLLSGTWYTLCKGRRTRLSSKGSSPRLTADHDPADGERTTTQNFNEVRVFDTQSRHKGESLTGHHTEYYRATYCLQGNHGAVLTGMADLQNGCCRSL